MTPPSDPRNRPDGVHSPASRSSSGRRPPQTDPTGSCRACRTPGSPGLPAQATGPLSRRQADPHDRATRQPRSPRPGDRPHVHAGARARVHAVEPDPAPGHPSRSARADGCSGAGAGAPRAYRGNWRTDTGPEDRHTGPCGTIFTPNDPRGPGGGDRQREAPSKGLRGGQKGAGPVDPDTAASSGYCAASSARIRAVSSAAACCWAVRSSATRWSSAASAAACSSAWRSRSALRSAAACRSASRSASSCSHRSASCCAAAAASSWHPTHSPPSGTSPLPGAWQMVHSHQPGRCGACRTVPVSLPAAAAAFLAARLGPPLHTGIDVVPVFAPGVRALPRLHQGHGHAHSAPDALALDGVQRLRVPVLDPAASSTVDDLCRGPPTHAREELRAVALRQGAVGQQLHQLGRQRRYDRLDHGHLLPRQLRTLSPLLRHIRGYGLVVSTPSSMSGPAGVPCPSDDEPASPDAAEPPSTRSHALLPAPALRDVSSATRRRRWIVFWCLLANSLLSDSRVPRHPGIPGVGER